MKAGTEEERPIGHRSEKQKMLAGELYLAADPELTAERKRARRLTRLFNQTTEDAIPEREIAGGAIVCPGVTIGANSTIGAGSVVTRDIPPNVLAAGNPCRAVRPASQAR